MVDAMETNMNLYNPKDIMENGNTIIEGGRYSYDSFKIQDHLFKNTYPSDGEKMVFLTFDDGPSLDNTPKVLDILKEYDVRDYIASHDTLISFNDIDKIKKGDGKSHKTIPNLILRLKDVEDLAGISVRYGLQPVLETLGYYYSQYVLKKKPVGNVGGLIRNIIKQWVLTNSKAS